MELVIHGSADNATVNKPGWGWSHVETSMYANPKAVERVRSSLAKIGLPGRVNIMFDEGAKEMFAIVTDEERARASAMMHPGMVNFFVRNNSGAASRHNPLTPWIILHRMHHGFELTGHRALAEGARKHSTADTVVDMENELRAVLGENKVPRMSDNCRFVGLSCTMRSARVRQLFPFCLDIAAELFAQYHITGDISLRGWDDWQMDEHTGFGSFHFKDQQVGKFKHFYVSKPANYQITDEKRAAVDEIITRYKPKLVEAIQHEAELMKTVPVFM